VGVASFAFLVAGWIQGPSPQPVWYNAVLLGAAVTVAGAFLTNLFTAWQDRKRRREALLASYLGEVGVIRTELKGYLERTISSLEDGELPGINKLVQPAMPRKVFEETVGVLGEIGDALLVQRIANLYAQIERTEKITHELVELGVPETEHLPESLKVAHYQLQSSLLGDAVMTSSILKELLLHNPRAQATDLMKTEFRDEEDNRDTQLRDKLQTLLKSIH
jgi:hypothetical protein